MRFISHQFFWRRREIFAYGFLLFATTLEGWFATAFAHAVFDVFAARFTRRASTHLTHTITPSPSILPQVSVCVSFPHGDNCSML